MTTIGADDFLNNSDSDEDLVHAKKPIMDLTTNDDYPQEILTIKSNFEMILKNIGISKDKTVYEFLKYGYGVYKLSIYFQCVEVVLRELILISSIDIVFDKKPTSINFETYISSHDMRPFNITSKYSYMLAAQHLVKLNSTIKFGAFCLDEFGNIKFKTVGSFELTGQTIFNSLQDHERWFKITYLTATSTLKSSAVRLLRLLDLISKEAYERALSASTNMKKIPPFQEDIEKYILKNFTKYLLRLREKSESNQAKRHLINQMTEDNLKIMNNIGEEDLNKSISFSKEAKNTNYSIVKIIQITDEKFLYKSEYFELYLVKCELENKNIKELVARIPIEMESGEFSKKSPLEKLNLHLNQLQKATSASQVKLMNERIIASNITENFGSSVHYYIDNSRVPNFFEVESKSWQPLDKTFNKNEKSICSIFYWIRQLCISQKYSKNAGLNLLNLCPKNLLLEKNFDVKLTDLSEAIVAPKTKLDELLEKNNSEMPSNYSMKTSKGLFMPYRAPETFKLRTDISDRSDIFSIAHIIYGLITSNNIFQIKQSSYKKLAQNYEQLDYKVANVKSSLLMLAPKLMMKYVYMILMMCLLPHPINRITIEDLTIYFKELFKLSEKLF